MLAALASLALAACGGGGEGGGGSDEVAEALGYQTAEGSANAPVAIGDLNSPTVVRYDGKVGNGTTTGGTSYYLVQGATPGVDYTVTLTNLTDDADVFVYQGDPTYSSDAADRAEVGLATEAFTLAADQDVTALYMVVEGEKTAKGATYTLSITPKPQSEGTQEDPIDLFEIFPNSRPGSTVGNDAGAGIGDDGDSYYKITVPADTRVLISLTDPTADADLYVSLASDFTDDTDVTCLAVFNGAVSEACVFDNTGVFTDTDIYIGIDGFYALEGSAYTINVTLAPEGAGTVSALCDLGAAPGTWDQTFTGGTGCGDFPLSVLAGGVAGIPNAAQGTEAGNSYYQITGLTTGQKYVLTLEDATDYVDLYVYGKDPTFSTPIPGCEPPYDDETVQRCEFIAGPSEVRLAVDGFYSLMGAVYKLTLFPAFVTESSADDPEELDGPTFTPGTLYTSDTLTVGPDAIHGIVGQTPPAPAPANARQVMLTDPAPGTNGDSYYTLEVNAGAEYRVTLIPLSGDVNLFVYADDTYTTPICQSTLGGLAKDTCVLTAPGPLLYLAVDGYFAKYGAAFKLEVREQDFTGDNTETNTGKPVGGAPLKFSGKVIGGGSETGNGIAGGDTRDSFYAVYVKPFTAYRVTITGFKADLDLYVREGSGYPSFNGSSGTPAVQCEPVAGEGVEEVCVANNGAQDPENADTYKYLIIGVDGSKGKLNAAYSFTIYVEETKPVEEASTGIIDLGDLISDPVALESTVDPGDKLKGIGKPKETLDSFYSVDVPGPGLYRIEITKLSQDANLYLYGTLDTWEKPLSTTACPNTQLGQDPKTGAYLKEYCDFTYKGETPGTLYFAVDGAYTFGSGAKYVVIVSKVE